jgi:four helix bundle protein
MDKKFYNLQVWHKSRQLILTTYSLLENFPEHEKYAMCSQLRRSVNSISANIAEGTGRRTLKDFVNFLYIAQGSLEESKSFFIIANDLNYIDNKNYALLKEQSDEIGRMLNGLIKSLQNKMQIIY